MCICVWNVDTGRDTGAQTFSLKLHLACFNF